MAYRRASATRRGTRATGGYKRASSARRPTRSTAARRPASRSRKTAKAPRGQTIKLVIEHVTGNDAARPLVAARSVDDTGPKKSKF